MDPSFIDGHNNVTPAFIDYCAPLAGEIPAMTRV